MQKQVEKLEKQRIQLTLPVFIEAPSNQFESARFNNQDFTSVNALQSYCEVMGMRAMPQIIMNVPNREDKPKPGGILSAQGGGVSE